MLDIDLLPQGLELRRWMSSLLAGASEPASRLIPLGVTPTETILEEASIRVLRYRGATAPEPGALPLVIIPSLINRHYILDLLPGKSLVEYLLSRGLPVYLLQWLPPEDEDRWLSFDRLITGRLKRAVQSVMGDAGHERVRLLGHCLGGTMGMVFSLRFPEIIASLALLTAPVDFELGGQLTTWTRFEGFQLDTMMDAYGNMPWPAMQAAFHLLRPVSGATKYLKILPRLTHFKFVRNFLAIELWAMDNMSFPGACYRTVIQTFYRDNQLARGRIRLAGKRVSFADLSCPVLSISSEDDPICPPETTLSRAHLAPGTDRLLTCWKTQGGHIGCLLGRRAQEELWPRLARWLLPSNLSEEFSRAP